MNFTIILLIFIQIKSYSSSNSISEMTLFFTAAILSFVLVLTFVYFLHYVAKFSITQQNVKYQICSTVDNWGVSSVTVDKLGTTQTLKVYGKPLVNLTSGTISVAVELDLLGDFINVFNGNFKLCEHTICPVVQGKPSDITFSANNQQQSGTFRAKMNVLGPNNEVITCVKGLFSM